MAMKKVALLSIAAVLLIYFLFGPFGTRIVFFSIGQGDSALLQSGWSQVLIDAGPNDITMSKLGRAMPYLDKTIEYVVISHPHLDHYHGAISAMRAYQVRTLVVADFTEKPSLYSEMLKVAEEQGVTVEIVRAGDSIQLGNKLKFDVLWPLSGFHSKDPNEESVVMLLSVHGEKLALFTGDVGRVVEEAIAPYIEGVPLLKVGHHGSKTSTSYDFLRAMQPKDAVISVGKNAYGHPARIVRKRLEAQGIRIWRTDEGGDVRVLIEGGGYDVIVCKPFCIR